MDEFDNGIGNYSTGPYSEETEKMDEKLTYEIREGMIYVMKESAIKGKFWCVVGVRRKTVYNYGIFRKMRGSGSVLGLVLA